MPFPIAGGRSPTCALVWVPVVTAAPVPPLVLPGAVVHGSLVFSLPQGPLLKGKRCVVLADGFYEWQQCGGGKQPYFIYFPQSKDDQVLSLGAELCPPCSLRAAWGYARGALIDLAWGTGCWRG